MSAQNQSQNMEATSIKHLEANSPWRVNNRYFHSFFGSFCFIRDSVIDSSVGLRHSLRISAKSTRLRLSGEVRTSAQNQYIRQKQQTSTLWRSADIRSKPMTSLRRKSAKITRLLLHSKARISAKLTLQNKMISIRRLCISNNES
jgi:hypothetical protein